MDRHVLSVLVNNHSGVLTRVAGLFSRRGYNIDSLSVGETENPLISRMTIVARGDEYVVDQVKKQLNKLIDVIQITRLEPDNQVCREIALIKVKAEQSQKAEIIETVGIFRAKVIDVGSVSLTIELTGDESKIAAFLELMEPYGIEEIARSGLTALARGTKEVINLVTRGA